MRNRNKVGNNVPPTSGKAHYCSVIYRSLQFGRFFFFPSFDVGNKKLETFSQTWVVLHHIFFPFSFLDLIKIKTGSSLVRYS